MSDLEKSFEEIQKEVSEKMETARKLLTEANELAASKGTSLYSVDPDTFYELQNTMDDVGLVTERDSGWNSSGCSW